MTRIEQFIINFKKGFCEESLVDTFLNGNCYHFAKILSNVFNGEIVYDEIAGHFMFYKHPHYYDIRGIVNPESKAISHWPDPTSHYSYYHNRIDDDLWTSLCEQCVYLNIHKLKENSR